MSMDESVPRSDVPAGNGPWDFGIGGPGTVGVVVLDQSGQLDSANDRARALLGAGTAGGVTGRLAEIGRRLTERGSASDADGEMRIAWPDRTIVVHSYAVGDGAMSKRVLLLWEAGTRAAAETLLQQASRHRSFSFLSRDWLHDLKGILHIIRINHAILSRAIQQAGISDQAGGAKRLESIPKEVERLDRSLEVVLNARVSDQESRFDLGATCGRIVEFVSARAARQRVQVSFDLGGGAKDVVGIENQVQGALLNVLVNALEAVPESGHLVVQAEGGETVKVRVSDDGRGIQPEIQGNMWWPHTVAGPRGTAIGLHVARSIIEAHGGHITCRPNVPAGTCFEIDLPSAEAQGRL